MSFDFKVSLSVSFSQKKLTSEVYSMDWIDKEVGRIKEDDAAKKRYEDRQTAISSQSSGLWSDLRYLLKEAVEKLRATPEVRQKIGGLDFNDANKDIVKIQKVALPAVYVIITFQYPATIRIERETVTNGGVAEPKTSRQTEQLTIDLDDEGKAVLKAGEDRMLVLEDAVEYLLRPLLTYKLMS